MNYSASYTGENPLPLSAWLETYPLVSTHVQQPVTKGKRSDKQSDSELDSLAQSAESSLEEMLHQRTKVLEDKMAILTFEMLLRLVIRKQNFDRIENDRLQVVALLSSLDEKARYGARDHREKGLFYQALLNLESERRREDVEAWRGVVDVMRDWIVAWEGTEQARARGRFLNA